MDLSNINKNTGWGDTARNNFDEFGGIYFTLRCFNDIQYLHKMPKFYIDLLKYATKIFSISNSKCI